MIIPSRFKITSPSLHIVFPQVAAEVHTPLLPPSRLPPLKILASNLPVKFFRAHEQCPIVAVAGDEPPNPDFHGEIDMSNSWSWVGLCITPPISCQACASVAIPRLIASVFVKLHSWVIKFHMVTHPTYIYGDVLAFAFPIFSLSILALVCHNGSKEYPPPCGIMPCSIYSCSIPQEIYTSKCNSSIRLLDFPIRLGDN